jgi:hypothetical protein
VRKCVHPRHNVYNLDTQSVHLGHTMKQYIIRQWGSGRMKTYNKSGHYEYSIMQINFMQTRKSRVVGLAMYNVSNCFF